MRRTWLIGLAGAITIGLTVGGVASSAPSTNPPGVSASSSNNETAAGAVPAAFTAANLTHDNSYKVVAPCRIIDTRVGGGGILQVNVTRSFQVTGTTGFAPQGGTSGGCGIPSGAVAVTASVVSTGSTGFGRLRLWATGQPEPQIVSVIYQKGQENSQSITYGISDTGKFNAKAGVGATHMVVDVTGYFMPPIYGVFSSDGTLFRAGGLNLFSHGSTGTYILQAPRSIDSCAVAVTTWSTYRAEGYISGSYIYVVVTQSNGTAANAYFQAIVTC